MRENDRFENNQFELWDQDLDNLAAYLSEVAIVDEIGSYRRAIARLIRWIDIMPDEEPR